MDVVQDVGGVVFLEHLNLNIPDQMIALQFYLEVLGLTRDPFERVTTTAWINVGLQQFHLNLADHAEVIRGSIGLVIPAEAAVNVRLARMSAKGKLDGTKFAWEEVAAKGYKWHRVTGPWGNEFHVFDSARHAFAHANRGDKGAFLSPAFPHSPSMRGGIGIAYIEEPCSPGALSHIERYYGSFFSVPVRRLVLDGSPSNILQVRMGPTTQLYFREVELCPAWPGYHICVYVANFSVLYARFAAADSLYKFNRFPDTYDSIEEALCYCQFRVADVYDDDRKVVYQLEHEVRSIVHPYYLRPLVNRFGEAGITQPVSDHDIRTVFHGWFGQ